jgi:hypothetical protein
MMGSDRIFEPFIGNLLFSTIEGADFNIGQVHLSLVLRHAIDVVASNLPNDMPNMSMPMPEI